jgi:hypothetical protein
VFPSWTLGTRSKRSAPIFKQLRRLTLRRTLFLRKPRHRRSLRAPEKHTKPLRQSTAKWVRPAVRPPRKDRLDLFTTVF